MSYDPVADVALFNATAGIKKYNSFKKESDTIFDDKKLTKLRLDLIQEEVTELKDAIETRDKKEVIDALGDILYVVYGAADAFGINEDLYKAFNIIQKSNMSKFCKTEQEAIDTVKHYKNNDKRYDSPTYRTSIDKDNNTLFVVFNKSTGKILKSINYTEANFDVLL
tara:strand:+ start:2324 stop:2824 length:501 start_codon:yes stop_codon:yes gene_type:complete